MKPRLRLRDGIWYCGTGATVDGIGRNPLAAFWHWHMLHRDRNHGGTPFDALWLAVNAMGRTC